MTSKDFHSFIFFDINLLKFCPKNKKSFTQLSKKIVQKLCFWRCKGGAFWLSLCVMELNNKKSSIRTEKLVKDYGKRRVVKGVNIGLESGLGIF